MQSDGTSLSKITHFVWEEEGAGEIVGHSLICWQSFLIFFSSLNYYSIEFDLSFYGIACPRTIFS